ncbi:hypothetical protein Tco_0965669 [Tanacetum coccineum]
MQKYSATPFDKVSLDEYDQNDKLFQMLMKSKSFDKHPARKALYDALVQSLHVDEDDMDRVVNEPPTQKRRRQDNQDQDPSADLAKEKKKRKQKDYESTMKDKDQVSSSKKGKYPSKSSKSNKPIDAEDVVHEVDIDVAKSVENDVVDADNPTQADDSVPKRDNSKWFKEDVMVRPETPDPEWHKEPSDAPEQPWFNDLVNAQKDPLTFEDVMGSFFDFTNFTKNCLQKDKITKANLEGSAFKLIKGRYRNYIELEYNFEQCYLALTSQLDWVNPEGNRVPHDLSDPLPLQGPQVLKKRVEDIQLGVESYQTKLNLTCPQVRCDGLDAKEPYTIFHKPRGVVYLNKDNKKYLMRADELYKFGDGTLKKVHDKPDFMLHNFVLGYHDGMPKRAWTDKDQDYLRKEELRFCLEDEEMLRCEHKKIIVKENRFRLDEADRLRLEEENML